MRIALYHKDNLLRDALSAMLTGEHGIEIVGATGAIGTTLSAANVHKARVLVFDADTVEGEGLKELKAFSDDSPCEMLAFGQDETKAEKAGIPFDKFIPLSGTKGKLAKGIFDLAGKEERPRIMVREKRPIYGMVTVLTPREHDIALKIAEGLNNRDISEQLKLAEQTVKNLVSVIMRKMGCTNRTQVALKLSGSTREA